MKKCWLKYMMPLLLLFAIALTFVLPILAAERGKPTAQAVATENGSSATACLNCHGPFEKLASAPSSFVMKSGEKVTPHRYVPHDLKEIPDCVSCHKPHSAIPTKSEIQTLPKPNVETCFSCHHSENFRSCKSCHKGS